MAIALTLITLAFGRVVGRNPHSLHDRARGPSIGTDGSNPALSSAESAANLTPGRHGGDAASEEIVWARRRAESHVKPRRVRTELTESAELEVRIHSPPAVSQANFQLGWGVRRRRQGTTLGVVGESGCGKSTDRAAALASDRARCRRHRLRRRGCRRSGGDQCARVAAADVDGVSGQLFVLQPARDRGRHYRLWPTHR